MLKRDLQIFYDGACPLCRRENDHYKKLDINQHIDFIDISQPDFLASDYGLDAEAVHKKMHVKSKGGEVFTGVDAFLKIWEFFPKYQKLKGFVGFPLVKPFAHVAYLIFAKIRPYLPGRKLCQDQSCLR